RRFEGKIAIVTGSRDGLGREIARHLMELGAIVVDDEATVSFEEAGLDFLVHCPPNGSAASIGNVTAGDWESAFRANIVDLHRDASTAVPLMQRHGGGRIVAFSTTSADRPSPDGAVRGTVDAAVESLTRYLATELAPQSIRVNCVKTGAASTPSD